MTINGIAALGTSAVQSAARPAASTEGSPAVAGSGPDFGQMLSQVVSAAVGTVQAGESAAIQGLQGALPPFKVVETIMGAQRALQQALAIRDKAVAAYQEVTRMAI
jgi:flagellar hook-basal body complex protein FliE